MFLSLFVRLFVSLLARLLKKLLVTSTKYSVGVGLRHETSD